MTREIDIPDNIINLGGNGAIHSPAYSNKVKAYQKSKVALLGAYLEDKITANLLVRLTKTFHDIELDQNFVKGMLENQYMVEYMSENHDVNVSGIEKQLRLLIKELEVTPAFDNPWDDLNIVKSINAHFKTNTFVRKFYRRHYRRDDLIQFLNTEISYYNENVLEDVPKIEGLTELREILSLAAEIEVSDDPLPVYEELAGILVF